MNVASQGNLSEFNSVHARRNFGSPGLYPQTADTAPVFTYAFHLFFPQQSLSLLCSVCVFFSAAHNAGSKHALCMLCHNSCPPARTKIRCNCSATKPPSPKTFVSLTVSHLRQSVLSVLATKLSLSGPHASRCGSSSVGQPARMFCW